MQSFSVQQIYPLTVRLDEDLLAAITNFAVEHQILVGRFSGLGHLKQAALEYFRQVEKDVVINKVNRPVELINVSGNISEKNGLPFIAGKLIVSELDGRIVGGALTKGNKVFHVEILIEVLEGGKLHREFDSNTGLSVWSIE